MASRPACVVFDVNETLFGLDALGDAFETAGLPGSALDLWFARTLADGFALATTGDFATFGELGRFHLRRILRSFALDHGDEQVEEIVGAFRQLEPYEDVEPSLRRLHREGVRAVTLTNGDADITRDLLATHQLDELVERCFDVGQVAAWKPREAPYAMVADELDLPRDQLAMVAVHSWDVHGAKRAGLTTAWVSRLEGQAVPQMIGADVTGRSLVEVVDSLLALG